MRIRGYVLEREFARGAGGALYLARPPRGIQATRVVVKTLADVFLRDPAARRDFLRETALLQEVRHRDVVSLLAFGIEGDRPWFAMEYHPRGSAAALVAAGGLGLSLARAAAVVIPATRGLAALHAAGMVHRDVKPSNVLLADDGRGLIGDLGLAKRVGGRDNCSTLTGTTAGSPDYMPREAIGGFRDLMPSADVFSIAASFYYLLSGCLTRDFEGRTTWRAVVEGPIIPLSSRRLDLPAPLLAVIDRALSDDPAARPADAGELLMELERAVPGLSSFARA